MSVVGYAHRSGGVRASIGDYDQALYRVSAQLRGLGWIESLVVCGSYAKGSLSPGWSDLDLVAVYRGRLDAGRLAGAGLRGPGRANPEVPIGIDFVNGAALRRTRRVVGRPLAMTLEIRGYAKAIFGPNPFAALPDHPGDAARIRDESAMLVRADANSWLRRAIAGYPDPRERLFDAVKSLLRIAMFESSPMPKSGVRVADYCAAVRAHAVNCEIVEALTVAEAVRRDWSDRSGMLVSDEAEIVDLLSRVLVFYCEEWEPSWQRAPLTATG